MLIWLKLQLHLIKFNSNTNISKPTGRGLLLLGENPQLTFPQARIQFLIEQEGQDPITKEFEGPVLLQPIHSIEKFRELNVPPISRNPKIAYLLNQMGVVEEMGFGMKELRKLNNERNLPHPSYRMNDHYFIITLYLKTGVYKPATDLMDNLKKLNSKEKKGYDILADRK